MAERQSDETGTIFDISKEHLPWHIGIFVILQIPAITIAIIASLPYISFYDFIFGVFSKIASFSATYVTVSTAVVFVTAVTKYLAKRDESKERQGYERAAKIAKDRGVELPPYESDRDTKHGNSKKSSN